MNFNLVKTAVAIRFESMQKHPMFRVNIDKDLLWSTYLDSFPPGTNPVLRKRTEHDCSCCRHFVKSIGDVVAVIGDELVTLWDVQVPDYQAPMDAMAKIVRAGIITDVFLHPERTAGTDRNFQEIIGDPVVKTWTHFFVNVDSRHVAKRDLIPGRLGELRSARDVFARSLTEITDDAVDTVLELIAQNSLYRGEEHRGLVQAFRAAKTEYTGLTGVRRAVYPWVATGAVARIRSTVIGTLLTDLSEGKELDDAVRAYEAKVAPANYKRPKSLITKAMIDKAKATVAELGLTSALERRYATLSDVTINNVIFANRNARKVMTGNVFDDLAPTAPARTSDRVEEVPIALFLGEIVPRADSIEVLFENRLSGNLVSLIAPTDATALPLFKWPNRFSWTYVGDVADSIRERVKRAGGQVDADLCCRLAWYNFDDLDLHLQAPDGHIHFRQKHVGGGCLDVDMNVSPQTRSAVENIFYRSRERMVEGTYTLFVHQFNRRESIDPGFEVEIDYLNNVRSFVYSRPVEGNVIVAKFRYTHAAGLEILESLPSTQAVRTLWGLPTQTYHQVSALMLSPNYWDSQGIGNLHYLFMLQGCANDGTARGFCNEFLRPELDQHRKVLEIVGSKMRAAEGEQLSGLGFSSTQRSTLTCRVRGSFSRDVKVVF